MDRVDKDDTPERLLTLREAAKIYGASPHALRRKADLGELRTVRLGRIYTRISWMEEMLNAPTPSADKAPPSSDLTDEQKAAAAQSRLRESVLMLRGKARARD
jgi:hypothetical protein